MSTEPNYPTNPDEEVIVQPVVAESSHLSIPRETVNDIHLLELLRDGNEAAFVALIDRYHASMFRLALLYVPTKVVAEEVVQEAWLGVLQGLQRFEERSSLKTWIFRILMNCAKTRALREGRRIAVFRDRPKGRRI
jgi:RNA polymerase sigma-70 factor (ECF subfamily)